MGQIRSTEESGGLTERPALSLFFLSFTALFLELMLIRWVPSTLRFVAYYANLMLISSFLGLGIGAMMAGRKWKLFGWFPPLLVVDITVLTICRYVVLPGSANEVRFYLISFRAMSYIALILIFVLNTALFVPLGQRIGQLFTKLPTLRAYAWDLLGSLCGTLGFGFFSLRFFSPAIGFAAVMAIYLILLGKWRDRVIPAVFFGAVLILILGTSEKAVMWSPYYYITVHDTDSNLPVTDPFPNIRTMMDPPIYSVSVNQDFYQEHGTIDLKRYTPGTDRAKYVRDMLRDAYMLPYQLRSAPDRVLVVGAGGGIDVEAALLSGAKHVDAAEIDRKLVDISERFNASGVYDDPRVTVHINDARAYFREAKPGYDFVVFGFLDSQALFSYSSNIRLDGYIYTVQSLRTAYSLLNPNGILSLSFVTPQPWLAAKLHDMMKEATGVEPVAYISGIQTILCAPRSGTIHAPDSLGRFARVVDFPVSGIDLATDNWPYLYLSRKTIPGDYLLVIGSMVGLSIAVVLALRGTRIGRSDGHFFFLGMGFLLLETKSITDCSLYFGTTWFVTMLVLTGILGMVLAANAVAMYVGRFSFAYYLFLFIAVLVPFFVSRDWVLSWPLVWRMVWTLVVVPLPIFFAGMIFSVTFKEAGGDPILLGANLIGATIGGFCEYLSMAIGTNALTLIILGAYCASLYCYASRKKFQSAGVGA